MATAVRCKSGSDGMGYNARNCPLDFLGPQNTGGDPKRRSYSYVHLSDLKVDHMWRYAFLLHPKP
jgi:hypothetical protein